MAQYAAYGLQIAQGVAGFMIGSIQAKLDATLQKYQNQILQVQESMNANRITINEIDTMDASVRLNFAIQVQSASDQGAAEVMAAAAGVKGSNVDSTTRGLRRSAAFAQGARESTLTSQMRSHLEERRSNAINTIASMGIEVNKGPSILSAAIGVGMKLLETYQDSNPVKTKSIVKQPTTPSQGLGLGSTDTKRQDITLLDPNEYWKFHTGPNG